MGRLIGILIVFILGFFLGAGAGFRVFEGISSDLVLEAFDNSIDQMGEAYQGSNAQAAVDAEKEKLEKKIKVGIINYLKQSIGMEDEEE